MTKSEDLKATYEEAAAALEREGPAALDPADRRELAVLYVREARKGSLLLSVADPPSARKALAAYVRAHFGAAADLKVTIDYQKELLKNARALAGAPHPISAVILYATWAEHWLNAQLLLSALANGSDPKDAAQMLRDANLPAKLGWLWKSLHLPPIPDKCRNSLRHLFKVRNEYLHYNWSGKDPDLLGVPEPRLTSAIVRIEDTVKELREYDLKLLAPHIAVAEVLLEQPIIDHLRTIYDSV